MTYVKAVISASNTDHFRGGGGCLAISSFKGYQSLSNKFCMKEDSVEYFKLFPLA